MNSLLKEEDELKVDQSISGKLKSPVMSEFSVRFLEMNRYIFWVDFIAAFGFNVMVHADKDAEWKNFVAIS